MEPRAKIIHNVNLALAPFVSSACNIFTINTPDFQYSPIWLLTLDVNSSPLFQGLTKRRRKILTEAGLLFDSEKEKARLEVERRQREEEEARERERRQKELQGNPLFKSTLSVCQEVSEEYYIRKL